MGVYTTHLDALLGGHGDRRIGIATAGDLRQYLVNILLKRCAIIISYYLAVMQVRHRDGRRPAADCSEPEGRTIVPHPPTIITFIEAKNGAREVPDNL